MCGLIQVSGDVNHLPTTRRANTDEIINKHPELFKERIGQFKDHEVKLDIDSSVKSISRLHGRVPFHLRAKVQNEEEQLLKDDATEKVDGPTLWLSPIVVTHKPKAPDKIRMCADMRAANTDIERERHVTPTVADIIGQTHGSSIFSKLDLRSG